MPKTPSDQQDNQVAPDSRLEKRTRREFSQDYKRRIIAEADACKHGELGQLLRRERLYSSQLKEWRRQLAEQGGEGLSKTSPGPSAAKTPEQRRIEQLEKDNQRLNDELQAAHDCLDLQKKALSMLDHTNNGNSA